MTKIDIISGFLGAGKTTLIRKLLKEALQDTKVVLIENEFGEIGIDGGFLKESGVEMKEMNSGCICCSLVGDFGASLQEVLETYGPERILIEPSGVGKLSDVIRAVQNVHTDGEIVLSSAVAVVDASKCKMYAKNFGEFFLNQIGSASLVILSRTGNISAEKTAGAVELVRTHNPKAAIITTPWESLDGMQILKAMEEPGDWMAELLEETRRQQEHKEGHGGHEGHCHSHAHGEGHEACHSHEHGEGHEACHSHEHGEGHEGHCHDHEHGEGHGGHCHDHEHGEGRGGHCHDHEHGEGRGGHCHSHERGEGHEGHCHSHEHGEGHGGHHHTHDHGPGCTCGCHDHDHHHHADEVFTSWGKETAACYTKEEIANALKALEDEDTYGIILRAKGMLPDSSGNWTYFDYVPGETDIRDGRAELTGKICVIGSQMKEDKLQGLFAK